MNNPYIGGPNRVAGSRQPIPMRPIRIAPRQAPTASTAAQGPTTDTAAQGPAAAQGQTPVPPGKPHPQPIKQLEARSDFPRRAVKLQVLKAEPSGPVSQLENYFIYSLL